MGKHPGDMAEMAYIEFVDFDFAAKSAEAVKTKSQTKEGEAKVKKATSKKAVHRVERKVRNKIQTQSRRDNCV